MTIRIGEEIFWMVRGNCIPFYLFQTTLRVCLVMFTFSENVFCRSVFERSTQVFL